MHVGKTVWFYAFTGDVYPARVTSTVDGVVWISYTAGTRVCDAALSKDEARSMLKPRTANSR